MSIQPRKQRKMIYNQPLHKMRKSIRVHLSRELLEKYALRSMVLRKGDTVKVIRGSFKGHVGSVAKVFPRRRLVSIDGATITKADGKKKPKLFNFSNLVITKLDLSDSWRKKLTKIKGEEVPEEVEEKEAVKEVSESEIPRSLELVKEEKEMVEQMVKEVEEEEKKAEELKEEIEEKVEEIKKVVKKVKKVKK